MTLPEFKALVRDQFFMLLVDEQHALATLPELAGPDQTEVADMIGALRRVAMATGELADQRAARMRRIEALLGVGSTAPDADIRLIQNDVQQRQPARRRRKERVKLPRQTEHGRNALCRRRDTMSSDKRRRK